MDRRTEELMLVQKVKRFSIIMVIAAVILFLGLSSTIFNYSVSHSYQYQMNYNRLSSAGRSLVASMKKTGEFESKVLSARRAPSGAAKTGGKFFDEVASIHSKR